ncbi:hypothetical protein D4764_06G0004020 [Takifugu flavidus]|uniref:Uncharacterized protein n=1 Tax=Takifugu flavidus TaxID=433684 RepID=A0A5C6MUF0_9TELE|nr:hypothetical protein D4764_06G0004020 [Takifugu flavidus]
MFSAAVPDSLTPVSYAQREPALIRKVNGAPTADLSSQAPQGRIVHKVVGLEAAGFSPFYRLQLEECEDTLAFLNIT